MHDNERPIAQQSAIIANQNRGKRQRKPFTLDDFSIYKPLSDREMPSGHYGAAAVLLVRQNRFPKWALFCFKELAMGATPDYAPPVPALFADDAILLHPKKVPGGYKGMLIALETAGEQTRVFTGPEGERIQLLVPHVHTKVIAEEDVVLLTP